jgi:AcrR family transcriptional regulator
MSQVKRGRSGTGLKTAAPTRRGRPPSADAADLRERILDVAETLFARRGFDAVSTREVAEDAGATTAMIHYYFRTKRQLFDTVFARRSDIINEERMRRLDAYAAKAGRRATVEGAIAAFLAPVLERMRNGGAGWRSYFNLIAMVGNNHEWGGEVMTRSFDPVVQRMMAIVRIALPKAREEDLYWSYHFFSGALLLTLSETDRINRLSGGRCRSDDIDAIEPRLVRFAAAGLREVCGRRESPRREDVGRPGQRAPVRHKGPKAG